ncbi:RHS repeat-associated core domain-containing protein [Pseudomonas sp. PDM16]|nr:RHS repeat-associated core domain-containing protein [Pseudomonas sp. PDM16]
MQWRPPCSGLCRAVPSPSIPFCSSVPFESSRRRPGRQSGLYLHQDLGRVPMAGWTSWEYVRSLTYGANGNLSGRTTFYLHADHLNSPRLATNQSGQEVWCWKSDAFGDGVATVVAGSGLDVISLRFPGQYYDFESGLHYNYFRDYDPQTGRYVESDPIGLAGGLNTFGYVEGSPMVYIDPTGETALAEVVTVWLIAITVIAIVNSLNQPNSENGPDSHGVIPPWYSNPPESTTTIPLLS